MDSVASIDRETALDRLGGDRILLGEIAGLFLEEYPSLLDAMESALRLPDLPRLAGIAHTLKGSVANFGAEGARLAAMELEAAAKNGDHSGAALKLKTLREILARLQPALETLRDETTL